MVFLIRHWNVDAQGLFKLTMKLNATQVMAKVVALATNKIQPQIVNHGWMHIMMYTISGKFGTTYSIENINT